MTLRVRENGTFVAVGGGGGGGGWVRNPLWPTFTIPEASEQKVVGIHQVWPSVNGTDANFVAMLFRGAYTVDWGDGSAAEEVADNVQVNRNLDWEAGGLYSASVDVNDAASGTLYYIENLGDTSQTDWNTLLGTSGLTYVVGDQGTAAVAGSTLGASTGRVSELPYKVATIVVTPQAAQNLTTIDLGRKHSQAGLVTYSGGWLDIAISAASCTSLTLRTPTQQGVLEQCTIVAHAVTTATSMFDGCINLQSVSLPSTASLTTATNMFRGCTSLQSVSLPSTASLTTATSMFQNCASLQSVSLFDTASLTTAASMFSGCTSLQSVSLPSTASLTTATSMFQNCSSLQSVSLFDTASLTTATSMFQNCSSLQSVSLFDTASLTTATNMFSGCTSLQLLPLLNTAAVTTATGMFDGCTSLQLLPLFNTAAVTTATNMFRDCSSLQSVPLFNTAAVTDAGFMFRGCSSLQSVPLFNTAAVTNATSLFRECSSLQSVPPFNTASLTAVGFMFRDCSSLTRSRITDMAISHSYVNCKLSADALDEIYTNLPSVAASSRTITVTGNWGTATHDPTIATAKGWLVTA